MASTQRIQLSNILALRADGPGFAWDRRDILIADGRILALAAPGSMNTGSADLVIDGARLLAAPGGINGHVHSWDHYLKGCIENLTMEISMSMIRPRRPVRLTPRQVYLRTMIGAIESLRTGATMLVDDLSLGQVFNEEHAEAALQAYEDSGTRAMVGFSMIDRPVVDSYPFAEDCFPPALLAELRGLPRPTGDQLLGLVRSEVARGRHPKSARVAVIVSPSAPHRCTDPFLATCKALADELDLPLMTHCQETRLQIVTGQAFYGCSLVEHMDRLGFLSPRTMLIHGTWLSTRDIAIIAKSGASVQYNPWSNAVLGAGVAPVREILDAGINMAFGTDGSGLPFGVSILNSMGIGAVLPKIADPEPGRWVTAAEVFRAATQGGARGFGLGGDLGDIAPGMKADIVCYSLDSTTLTPLNDPVRQIVYAERGRAVDTVLVDGEVVMRDGRLTRIDEVALLREAQAVHAELADTVVGSQADAAPFRDALFEVYRRSLACALAPDYHRSVIRGNNIAGLA